MTNQEIAKKIAERLIRAGTYSVDLCLPMLGVYRGAAQLYYLVRTENEDDVEELNHLAEGLRSRMVQAIMEILRNTS